MASSRPIAAGEDYTPDDINNLRNDVLDSVGGHKHNGTDGAKVPFSNLDIALASGSTPPTGGSKSYNDLANHVASSQGIHGLGSTAYVLGAVTPGFVIQGGYHSFGSQIVTFPVPFTQNGVGVDPISVVVTIKTSSNDPFSNSMGATIVGVSSTSFIVDRDGSDIAGVYWMAMGYKT